MLPALLAATCALPAARRDGPGVAGFVRQPQPALTVCAGHDCS
jgi:hypothetical protein